MNDGNGRILTLKKAGEIIGDWERIEKSYRKCQKGIFGEHIQRGYGISKNRTLWFDVHEDKGTKLEGDPRNSKYWYQRLSGKLNNRSESTVENTGELYNRTIWSI